MRKWFNKLTTNTVEADTDTTLELPLDPAAHAPTSWQRLKNSLVKTRQNLSSGLMRFFKKDQILDDTYWEELEEVLLAADFGLKTATGIIDYLKSITSLRHELDGEIVKGHLRDYLLGLLKPISKPFKLKEGHNPQVVLMVGVNGVGKTTSLAKLAYFLKGKANVMLAAGDTFRAAAIEQLQTWGERQQIPVVAQGIGSDSAAVIFDALQAAQARGIDVLLADTAGRLHTQVHLLQELQKIKRVLAKLDSEAPHDIFMVLDASIGQNALQQVRQFHQALGLSGLIVSKLDGTAKGGILFAIASEFKIPCYFIGIGEGLDDLRPFDPESYVQAILS
ncbi:MAG: signal recognition particle-docking protein FtsY [Gammaproteobacteria bacterium]|nr:signal recognition particle-docking protein FtsY [Gammaproteobacteria bacterium]